MCVLSAAVVASKADHVHDGDRSRTYVVKSDTASYGSRRRRRESEKVKHIRAESTHRKPGPL